MTGQWALRMTLSATEPTIGRVIPPRPGEPTTIRSIERSLATRTISSAGLPSDHQRLEVDRALQRRFGADHRQVAGGRRQQVADGPGGLHHHTVGHRIDRDLERRQQQQRGAEPLRELGRVLGGDAGLRREVRA